jgi:hypothetical protein
VAGEMSGGDSAFHPQSAGLFGSNVKKNYTIRCWGFGVKYATCRIAGRRLLGHTVTQMLSTHVIKTRVSPDTKVRVNEEAQRQLLTESVWLRRVVDAALRSVPVSEDTLIRRVGIGPSRERLRSGHPCEGAARARICIRIRHSDRLILRERAEARGMPAATYIAALVRAHLRALAPLPSEEVGALKRSIAELSAIGRNLNQLARVAHQTGRVAGPTRDDLRSMLKVCEAMREHIKELVRTNRATWEIGDAEAVT